MVKLIGVVLAVTGSLVGLLVHSQRRPQPLCVSGFVEADEARPGSRVGGRVRQVHVAEGQAVKAGDVLVELEPFQLHEQLAEAKAKLAAARAEVSRLRAGFRPEEVAQARAKRDELAAVLARLRNGARAEDVEVARKQVELAETQLALAGQNHRRVTQLLARQAVSREEADRAAAELDAARATAAVRKEELAKLKRGARGEEIAEAEARLRAAHQAWVLLRRGYRPEEVAQAEAAAEAAAAAVAAAARQLDETVIKAATDGTVEAADLRPGDLVGANQPVVTLRGTDKLWVRAYVPEGRLAVRVGSRVEVTVDSCPGERFPATVTFLAGQAEFTPGNVQTPEERSKQVFRIKVVLDTCDGRLRPGMAADVWLQP